MPENFRPQALAWRLVDIGLVHNVLLQVRSKVYSLVLVNLHQSVHDSVMMPVDANSRSCLLGVSNQTQRQGG